MLSHYCEKDPHQNSKTKNRKTKTQTVFKPKYKVG